MAVAEARRPEFHWVGSGSCQSVFCSCWARKLTRSYRVIAYSRYFNKGLPLELKERRQIAQDFHRRMLTAFAA